MKSSRRDSDFNNPRICHITPRYIELDRVLINLYMLLKHDGHRPVARTGRRPVTVDSIVSQLIDQHGDILHGFADYRDVVHDWVYSDLVDIVNRGKPDRERVAAPLPLHLNAYKLRNPHEAQDFRASEHLFSMLQNGQPGLAQRLANYLGQGMDTTNYDTYDGETPLDMDTLLIVRMVDSELLKDAKSSDTEVLESPLCVGQARMMCDDVRRLLVYDRTIPRSVLIGYLRAAFGLHLGLYLLRLFRQVSGWVRDKQANPSCLNCPVDPTSDRPFAACPYAFQNSGADERRVVPGIMADMGESPASHVANEEETPAKHMADLARQSCARHYASMNDYIQSVFTVNQLFQFAEDVSVRRDLNRQPSTVAEALAILANPPESFNYFFGQRVRAKRESSQAEEHRPEVESVCDMKTLTPLEMVVELLALEKMRYYRPHLIDQLDAVFMKNQETCLERQGKGRRNERRWYVGSRLLEMFVQIAVLQPVPSGTSVSFRSRTILINQFTNWLQERYGVLIAPQMSGATIQDLKAFNANLARLKTRLREIGFYSDLSDAYNTQTIHPRYAIEQDSGA